ncbi:hypothetical protein NGUA18_00400 [Salmonella enterica]|nr:hypothetical protein NGUA18_00400 [Salmonella enterica]
MGFRRVSVVVSISLRQGNTCNTGIVGNIDVTFYIKIHRHAFADIECFICVLSYITILIGISEVKRFIIIINGGISDVQREHITVIPVSVNSISTVVEPIIFRIPIVIQRIKTIVITNRQHGSNRAMNN